MIAIFIQSEIVGALLSITDILGVLKHITKQDA